MSIQYAPVPTHQDRCRRRPGRTGSHHNAHTRKALRKKTVCAATAAILENKKTEARSFRRRLGRSPPPVGKPVASGAQKTRFVIIISFHGLKHEAPIGRPQGAATSRRKRAPRFSRIAGFFSSLLVLADLRASREHQLPRSGFLASTMSSLPRANFLTKAAEQPYLCA